MLISDKLKKILESAKFLGYQFLPATVYSFDGLETYQYWLTNTFIFFPEYIEFSKSELWLSKTVMGPKEIIHCNSYEEFEEKKRMHAPALIRIDNFFLDNNKVEYDLFAVNETSTVIAHCISEELKNKIEDAGCTGFEFLEV